MKLDTSSFESHAPLLAGANDLFSGLSKPPSIDLPICGDFNGFQKDAVQMVKSAKGMTTLAFIFKNGVYILAEDIYSFEVHHGGYFEKQLDGITMKYKVARSNKEGGKCFIDGLDPDQISWLELHNIAWDLGYRERPICFYFKCPGTSVSEGWVSVANDGASVEMVKLLPKNMTIGLYIVGGGRRKKEEAKLNHLIGEKVHCNNTLTLSAPDELATVFEDANLAATILNRPEMDFGSTRVVGEGSSGSLNGGAEGQQSQSTFANLDGIVHDFFTQPTQESPQIYEVEAAKDREAKEERERG